MIVTKMKVHVVFEGDAGADNAGLRASEGVLIISTPLLAFFPLPRKVLFLCLRQRA